MTSGRRLVAARVAAEFGVDERTIRRDLLHTLKRDWGLPVLYDRSAKHWLLADGAATASLPQTIVNEGDRLSLLLSLQAAEQYKGTPLYDRLQRIYGRLLTLLPHERRTRFNELASKVRFEGLPAPSIDPGVWDVVLLATEAGESIEAIYRTGWSGSRSRRMLDPYGIVVAGREWYLIARDQEKKQVQAFFLPRIESAELSDRRFRYEHGWSLDRYLATAVNGRQTTGPVYSVRLAWTEVATQACREFVWNSTQRVVVRKNGRTEVHFSTGALFEVERLVLSWAGQVRVLGPKLLQRRLAQAITRLQSAG